jgi:hypothetical protein
MEPVLLRLINDFMKAYSGIVRASTIPLTTVRDIVVCGLLESTMNRILCGSPDGACYLTMHDGRTTTSVRAAIEMKYLSSLSTSAMNRDLLAEGEVARLEFVHVTDVGNKEFYRHVRNVAHRGQCLYHCIVLGVDRCLYVIGDETRISRVVVLHFDAQVISTMTKLIILAYERYLFMFESPAMIPQRWESCDLSWVGTVDNVRHHLGKRIGMRKFVDDNGVQPTPRHILPAIISEWNGKKGGVDNLSGYMARMKGKFEKYLKPTQRILLDQIKIALLQAFHSYRGSQIANDVLTGKIGSMRQIRLRLNNVCNLDDFLSDCIPALDMWLTEGGDKAEAERKQSAIKARGLAATEMPSPNSPVAKKSISYNHRKKWTAVPMLQSCRLKAKGRLKVKRMLTLILTLIVPQM